MNKIYWFFLESHIYVDIKGRNMLTYDTHTGLRLEFSSQEAVTLVQDIYKEENLGSVKISDEILANPNVYKFVHAVVKMNMGKLQDVALYPLKPIVLLPILLFNSDVEKINDRNNLDLAFSRNIGRYLLDINVFLNNNCSQNCVGCKGYHKQFFSCNKSEKQQRLSKELLENLLNQIRYYPLRTINITGGNIYQYPYLSVLNNTYIHTVKEYNFFIHYLNYEENAIVDSYHIHLMITYPVLKWKLAEVYALTKRKNVTFHAIIENEDQYVTMLSLLKEIGIDNIEIQPFFNGKNIHFFENNVYLDTDDIFSEILSMREIFRNQKLNGNSFGSLYVLPNGEVKANMNEVTIGNLKHEKIVDIIHHELIVNTAWRTIRAKTSCQTCIYQNLCPPISNYERVLKHNNLCHVP